jgi:hypothetical protein
MELVKLLQSATSKEESQLRDFTELENNTSWEEFLVEYKPVIKSLAEFYMTYEEKVMMECRKVCANQLFYSQQLRLDLLYRDCAQLNIHILDKGMDINISSHQALGWYYTLSMLQKILHEKIANQLPLFKNKKLKAYHFAMDYREPVEMLNCFEKLNLKSTDIQHVIMGAKLAYGFFIKSNCMLAA